MKLRSLLMAAVLCALCAVEASALEYYVDTIGFREAKQFLKPPARNKKRSGQER